MEEEKETTMPTNTHSTDKPQIHTGNQHPEELQQDLNPHAMAGQNLGTAGAHAASRAPTAHELKAAHRQFSDLSDDELKRIRILPAGTRLEQGATYFDLKDPARGEFTARGDMEAGPDEWCVAKSDTDYQLWNRLIGVTNPDRLETGNVR
jgi:hypothetical protein